MPIFHGLPTGLLENDHLRLEYLTGAGPRIVRLSRQGRVENLLAETPQLSWDTPNGIYRLHGGHRLWLAPEDPSLTYFPEETPVTVRQSGAVVELESLQQSGIRKQMRICLAPDRPAVEIIHRIELESGPPRRAAAWAITQLPLGGNAFLPQIVGPYPPAEPLAVYWPNRSLVLWQYTSLRDPRLVLSDDCVRLSSVPPGPPAKIGCLDLHGWAAYAYNDVLFSKHVAVEADANYPDRGCNVELYCNQQFLELETLSPLRRLAQDAPLTHVERWEIHSGIPQGVEFTEVQDLMRARS